MPDHSGPFQPVFDPTKGKAGKRQPPAPGGTGALLLEDGSYLLLEDGFHLLLE